MNIILPINISALRVSPSTSQNAKTALYDFSLAGQSPLSSTGGLIAANQFLQAEEPLNREPGIHLHWSIPRAYTQGMQSNSDGSLSFPTLPNRWLVTRIFLNLNTNTSNIACWILEADAHSANQQSLNATPTTLPWSDTPGELFGVDFHYVGYPIPLTGAWTEPGGNSGGIDYLGPLLQAPLAYGDTFTAYYRHSQNLFGMYDTLSDLFPNPNELENNCDFTVSYCVQGWVSPQSSDTTFVVLNKIVAAYNALPVNDRPEFPIYLQQEMQTLLKWSLDDYTGFTTANAGQTQGVLSGIVSDITWNIPTPGNPTYPSALPDPGNVTTAIGNNSPEALSAYLNRLENGDSTPDPGSVTTNLEWLLNALQYGQLGSLGDGELGVGQLDEYLHARSFGSQAGGTLWSVREKMTPGSKATPREAVEATLPLPLAKLLSRMNQVQEQYDGLSATLATRRQKLFFDWNYHINAIENNVIQGNSSISSDLSGAYLLDGLMQLFPLQAQQGANSLPRESGPPVYTPAPFVIKAPAAQYPDLSTYPFGTVANTGAAQVVNQLLGLTLALEGLFPRTLEGLSAQLLLAQSALQSCLAGGTTAAGYLAQAITALQAALALAATLSADFATIGSLATLKTTLIDPQTAALNAYTDPDTGIFAQYLAFTSTNTVPLPPGEVYTGQLKGLAEFRNVGSWSANGAFRGMKDLLDQLTGQGAYSPHLFDTQVAAVYAATAYFWRISGDTATRTTPYYLQMALQEITTAQAEGQNVSYALQQALNALTSDATVIAIGQSLAALTGATLPAILLLLTGNAPDPATALTQIDALLADPQVTTIPWSLPSLLEAMTSDAWKSLITSIESAGQIVLQRLPLAQQIALLGAFLNTEIAADFELSSLPAAPYWRPNEPVMLLAEPGNTAGLIQPVNRNGAAALLPCRLDTEIVAATGAVTFPPAVSALSTNIDPAIQGLSMVLQRLAEEALLLSPEIETVVTPAALQAAAQQNQAEQINSIAPIVLQSPPAGLTGKLPYYIAWSWWTGTDPFQPLFIFWQANYLYSQQFDFSGETLPADYLSQFMLDRYLVGYQPLPGSLSSFQPNNNAPNFFALSGVVTLSSASTANLCYQIRTYCMNQFGYDPSKGKPDPKDPNFAEEQLFYEAYTDFGTRRILTQGLSGFNPGMLQRAQELQLPLNIPAAWIAANGNNLPVSDFWPTQFLLNQSADWPIDWSSEALDFNAFATNNSAVYFNPLRAGFLQMQGITLVDIFGRYVLLPNPNPQAIAESMQSQPGTPTTNYPVYLPPRLVQPSRLLGRWLSADSPDRFQDFTEWNPHPAASPICGWLLPDHLDGSLALYNADGAPLGSLGRFEQNVRWFTVPGEAYTPGIDNRVLMVQDLAARKSNPAMRGLLETFAYPDETASSGTNFGQFLEVIDQAQQFIITKAMQEDRALAVLIGQPLALARATIRLQLFGQPAVSLDTKTYMPWNAKGPQFQLDGSGFIPYNFGNFNAAGLPQLQVPIRIGAVEYQVNNLNVPFFDDGVVGFFLNDDYGTLYTPVQTPNGVRIRSTAAANGDVAVVLPNGDALIVTLLIDPRASVHLTSGLLPAQTMQIPPEQYTAALNRILVTFLTAPVLLEPTGFQMPAPPEAGYDWNWWQVGQTGDQPIQASQLNTDATFIAAPLQIVDGWLKLKKHGS